MTRVWIEILPDRCGIHALGHATGSPETCAAVSAIVGMLAAWAKNERGINRVDLHDGEAIVSMRAGPEDRAVFRAAAMGLGVVAAGQAAYLSVDLADRCGPERGDGAAGGQERDIV